MVVAFTPVPVTSASVRVTAPVLPLNEVTPAAAVVIGICTNAPPLTAIASAGPVVRLSGQNAMPFVTVA